MAALSTIQIFKRLEGVQMQARWPTQHTGLLPTLTFAHLSLVDGCPQHVSLAMEGPRLARLPEILVNKHAGLAVTTGCVVISDINWLRVKT